jgi:hypothetical protein
MNSSVDRRLTLRFPNGARVYVYHFASGDHVATYQKADGSRRHLGSFTVRENGFTMTRRWGAWESRGWTYEFPIEIEGSRRYTLEPLENIEPDTVFAHSSRVLNGDRGAPVGLAVTEPLDARVMRNAPFSYYQH